jgi:flagellar motor switch protein FliN/FliY
MSVAEILKLGVGSIVELDRDVNDPVDLLVNRRPIARGEIVALAQNFALKITELIVL